jgi:cardiolipin synthase A/B
MRILRTACWVACFAVICSFSMLIGMPLPEVAAQTDHADQQASAYQVTTPFTTTPPAQLFLPLVAGPLPARLLIAAAHIDSVISGEGDEAILLWNIGEGAQPLAGWQLATANRQSTFPLTTTLTLAPGERLWCAANALVFRQTFGVLPACEWAGDSEPTVLNLENKLPLTNSGGHLYLRNAAGVVVDTLIYGDSAQPAAGWVGVAAQLYTRGDVASTGQVWQRKRDPGTGWPIDTHRASDWAGDLADLRWGRQVRMPGWLGWTASDLGRPQAGSATATVTLAVAPEGLYQPLATLLASATTSLDLSLYTLEHRELAQIIADVARRGVQVRLLLEGSPPGGIDDVQKWCVKTIVDAGGDVRYLAAVEEAPTGFRPRYRYLHAKYGVVDGQRIFSGTENFTYDAMPVDSSVPVGGRRGFYLITDAAPVVQALQRLFAIDWAPERFLDLHPFDPTHARYGSPPADFVFPALPLYPVTASPFRDPVTIQATAQFTVVSSPENSLRPDAGLHALLAQAGAGDEILATQLYEHKHWGESVSNPIADPNPRLQAMLDAARRGARVRLLLDGFFDDAEALRSNHATVEYIRAVAAAEGLDIEAHTGNPTLGGIHAKVVLVRVGHRYWSAIGSLNGGEVSHKLNREVMVLMDVTEVYTRLAEVFAWDWVRTK